MIGFQNNCHQLNFYLKVALEFKSDLREMQTNTLPQTLVCQLQKFGVKFDLF